MVSSSWGKTRRYAGMYPSRGSQAKNGVEKNGQKLSSVLLLCFHFVTHLALIVVLVKYCNLDSTVI